MSDAGLTGPPASLLGRCVRGPERHAVRTMSSFVPDGDSEVAQVGAVLLVDEDVRRPEVAMNGPLAVGE
jgi:hypothetical protein